MTSKTDISNRALSAIGARSTIANFDLEQSAEAKQARLLYVPTRDAIFRAAHWNFAKKTAYLSLLKSSPGTPENPSGSGPWDPLTMPALPWLYEYAYPSDCLLVRYVTPNLSLDNAIIPPLFSSGTKTAVLPVVTNTVPFSVASGLDTNQLPINVVNTNARQAIVVYTARIEAEDLWDALFQEAMVAALASRLCVALTGNLELSNRQVAIANQALVAARAQSGNEGLTRMEHTPDWMSIRGVPSAPGQSYVASWVQPSFLAA